MPADTPIRASTQQFLEIEDIQDDIVILNDGACALVLQVTAVNFGLLSEGEQDALIYAYAGLLNSLSFPVQIVIRSKKKDISAYLQLLKEQETKIKKPLLLEEMKKYREFVETTVKENEVLDKKFYVGLPFSPLEIGISSTLSQTVKPKKGLPFPKAYILERAKTILFPKRDHLLSQLRRLGLKAKQLTTPELLQLLYSIYNPESVGQQFVPSKDYAMPIVQAATVQLPTHSAGQNQEEVPMDTPMSSSNQPSPTPGDVPSSEGNTPPLPTPELQTPTGPGMTQTPGEQAVTPPVVSAPAAVSGSTPVATTGSEFNQAQSAISSAAAQATPPPPPPAPPSPGPTQTGNVPPTTVDLATNLNQEK